MSVADLIPRLSNEELSSLHDNARRLEITGSGIKKEQATQMRPLIEAELARRAAALPVKPIAVRAPRAKKAAAPKVGAAETA